MVSTLSKVVYQIAALALLWLVNLNYPNVYFQKIFYSVFALSIAYAAFKLIEVISLKHIKEAKAKYALRKALSTVFIALLLFIVVAVWIENTQYLTVSYGLIAAGVAFAMQSSITNFTGGIIIFTSKLYRLGDRIELNGNHGDVIDISMFYTTLLEVKGGTSSDQITGRLVSIPNNTVLTSNIYNYTKNHNFVWDEITLPLTPNSDWQKASEIALKVAKKELLETSIQVENDTKTLEEKYYLTKRSVAPSTYISLVKGGVDVLLRYPTQARQRRNNNDLLTRQILKELKKTRGIKMR